MSTPEIEYALSGLGFLPLAEVRAVKVQNQSVPFVSWKLGHFDADVYYLWPGWEYTQEVLDEIHSHNTETLERARDHAKVHEILQYCC